MHAEHQKQMARMVEHGMLEVDKINRRMMSGGTMMDDEAGMVGGLEVGA